jgi:peptidoglycan/LPS O-acetylase OafA/YrhL
LFFNGFFVKNSRGQSEFSHIFPDAWLDVRGFAPVRVMFNLFTASVAEIRQKSSQNTGDHFLKYRPDIDGLRAISVFSVILFHISPRHFPAGGIGVDIFFVISGFLIGKIIIEGIASDSFTYRDFYLRRIRRIIPAFLVCVIASTIAAIAILYPSEIQTFSLSALAALGCGSNIYFFYNSGYFESNSSWFPLLHTWTLGVEEQFYFVFPVIVIALSKYWKRRGVVIALSGLLLVSFAISQFQVTAAPSAAFYLLPSRGWELMIGVLANFVPKISRIGLRSALAILGLVLIGYALIYTRPENGFPGVYAIAPCLGALAILISGVDGGSPLHRLLGIWPMRLVGLASYSLYLWHWPIIVFYRYDRLMGNLRPLDALIVLIVIFIAGFLSW